MQRRNVLALACALLLSGCISANAADLRFNTGRGLIGAPSGYVAGSNVLPLDLNQAAVVNGGISTLGQGYYGGTVLGTGLGLGTGLYGNNCVSQLPEGTQLVSDGLGQTAVVLPGAVCMPTLTGCNVSMVGPQGPSALSLIGSSCIPVASLPESPPLTRITTTTTTTTTQRIFHHKAARHIVHRHCLHRIIHRAGKKVDFGS
jgi:hypothetical protein